MPVNSMDPVLVLIKRKARIGFWKNHKWRHDTGFPGGINVWVNHALLTTMGLSQSSRLDFFLSPVPFSKIYQFLTFAHSKNTKSKETYALNTPHRIWFNGFQLWGTAGRQCLWMSQQPREKHLLQYVPLNSAGLITQPRPTRGWEGSPSCFIVPL